MRVAKNVFVLQKNVFLLNTRSVELSQKDVHTIILIYRVAKMCFFEKQDTFLYMHFRNV